MKEYGFARGCPGLQKYCGQKTSTHILLALLTPAFPGFLPRHLKIGSLGRFFA